MTASEEDVGHNAYIGKYHHHIWIQRRKKRSVNFFVKKLSVTKKPNIEKKVIIFRVSIKNYPG
jgi:hypothetical protein